MSGLDIVYPTKTILEECEQSVPAPAPSFKECDFILQTTGVTKELRTPLNFHTISRLITLVRKYDECDAYDNTKANITSQGVYRHDPTEFAIFAWRPKDFYFDLLSFIAIETFILTEYTAAYVSMSIILKDPKFDSILRELFVLDTDIRTLRAAHQRILVLKGSVVGCIYNTINEKRAVFDITRSNDAPATDLESLPRPFFSCRQCGIQPTLLQKLQKCGLCKKVYYCGKICQALDWKSSHKVICKKN